MQPSSTAICPGSFDPPTEGHINIIERASKIFDKVIVAVAVNSSKQGVLPLQERIDLLKTIFKGRPAIEIDSFEDRLLVDYARSKRAGVILRGLRTIQDYEYEFQMALANKKLAPAIETIFMMTEADFSYLSSTLIREIVALGGSGEGMLRPEVEARLKQRLKRKGKGS